VQAVNLDHFKELMRNFKTTLLEVDIKLNIPSLGHKNHSVREFIHPVREGKQQKELHQLLSEFVSASPISVRSLPVESPEDAVCGLQPVLSRSVTSQANNTLSWRRTSE